MSNAPPAFDLNCVYFFHTPDGVFVLYGGLASRLRPLPTLVPNDLLGKVGFIEVPSLEHGPVTWPVHEVVQRIGATSALIVIDGLIYAWPGALVKHMIEFYAPPGAGLQIINGNNNAAASGQGAAARSFFNDFLKNNTVRVVSCSLAAAATVGSLALVKASTESIFGFKWGSVFSIFANTNKS